MLILFQIVFILFSLTAIWTIVSKKGNRELGPKGAMFWLLFWVAADVAVIWPSSTSVLAHVFGIGRGSDLVIYVSVALIFFVLFKLHIKLESLSRDVTSVIRDRAIKKHNGSKE